MKLLGFLAYTAGVLVVGAMLMWYWQEGNASKPTRVIDGHTGVEVSESVLALNEWKRVYRVRRNAVECWGQQLYARGVIMVARRWSAWPWAWWRGARDA